MKIFLHQTHHQVADFEAILTYIKEMFKKPQPGIHIFPELFFSGYPLQDLCLQKPFVDVYLRFQTDIDQWISENVDLENTCLLMGGLEYSLNKSGIPSQIKNVIYQIGAGKKNLTSVYTKRLLPNYDIFDEKKYFTKGKEAKIIDIFGHQFGVLICEDMWASNFYELDPVKDLRSKVEDDGCSLSGVFNLSASPYVIGKIEKRINRAKEISHNFSCPFFYVNRVGGEDEILFDGSSFAVNGDEVICMGALYKSEVLEIPFHAPPSGKYNKCQKEHTSFTWEELFQADLVKSSSPATLHDWTDKECNEVLQSLNFGIQEYARKSGFHKFSIALSGGMDSALVLTILKLGLQKNQELEAIYMPSIHSSPLSHELSMKLCANLQVPLKTMPIKFLHSTAKNLFSQTYPDKFEGLTDENIQSRLRGMLLYTRSNQINSMIINTSNKSELAVGYSTQYGDSVGAISMLGDVFKSQVFRLANYINKHYNNPIPEEIITRPPTAELRPGQVDTESLPPYERLDAMLEGILNYRYAKKDLLSLGFLEDEVEKTLNMYKRNEYKRFQFCPIVKISIKSFGFGYRIPMSKSSKFYNI